MVFLAPVVDFLVFLVAWVVATATVETWEAEWCAVAELASETEPIGVNTIEAKAMRWIRLFMKSC